MSAQVHICGQVSLGVLEVTEWVLMGPQNFMALKWACGTLRKIVGPWGKNPGGGRHGFSSLTPVGALSAWL